MAYLTKASIAKFEMRKPDKSKPEESIFAPQYGCGATAEESAQDTLWPSFENPDTVRFRKCILATRIQGCREALFTSDAPRVLHRLTRALRALRRFQKRGIG